MNDVLNLAKSIKDFTYNNDCKPTEYFNSITQIKDGFIIDFSFNGMKHYKITKNKITDKSGLQIDVDVAYFNLDMLFDLIQKNLYTFNIHQIDEAIEYKALKNDLMELVNKSATEQNINSKEFIKKWVDENSIPPKKKEQTVTLEGLIQDTDIFEFYLKHKDDIDKLLKKDGFFNEKGNINGLYEFSIDGTKRAVWLCLSEM
jgi:hypothetical protein